MMSMCLLLGATLAAAQDAPVLQRVKKENVDNLQEQKFAEEAREDYFTHSSVLLLNKVIFDQNVYGESDEVVHWIVHFCVSWFDGCQASEEPYKLLASDWHERVNTDLLKNKVRFAAVDCAVDKVLCNTEGVYDYPTVNHYTGAAKVAVWTPPSRKARANLKKMLSQFQSWLWTELGHLTIGHLDEAEPAVVTFNVSCGAHSAKTCAECPQDRGKTWCQGDCRWKDGVCQEPFGKYLTRRWNTIMFKVKSWMPDCTPDMLVLLVAVLGNAFVMSRGCDTAPAAATSPAKGASAQPATGEAPATGMSADADTKSIGSFLPEDWAEERKRIEL